MTKLIEISQLLNTPADTYINGAVEGYLVQIRPPFKEGAPGKAKLQDGGQTIDVSLWGQGFSHWEGKRVRFSGKGMKVTEYKGVKQLSVGDKVLVESAEADAIPGDPAPAHPASHSGKPHAASYPPDAWHQPHPQKPAVASGGEARLEEYRAVYGQCIETARSTVANASFADDPETIRNIATAYFIQAMKEGLKLNSNIPF